MTITDKEILSTALECGIMISTQYGQGQNQPMPVSDHRTLISFARKLEELEFGIKVEKTWDETKKEFGIK